MHHDQIEPNPLDNIEAKKYRAAVARLSYMSQDRADISYACRYLASSMANPREHDILALERTLRYVMLHPRCELRYYMYNQKLRSYNAIVIQVGQAISIRGEAQVVA